MSPRFKRLQKVADAGYCDGYCLFEKLISTIRYGRGFNLPDLSFVTQVWQMFNEMFHGIHSQTFGQIKTA
jgi:hypothetical protein